MNQHPLIAVNWNQLNRINNGRRKACRRAASKSQLNHNFSEAVNQDRRALVEVGEILSQRYHGRDSSHESIMTVYFSEPGARNWAQKVHQNLFGAALTSNGNGDLFVLLDDLSSAIGRVRQLKPTLSTALDRIFAEAEKIKARHFCKGYPLARDATSLDHERWLGQGHKQPQPDQYMA